MKNIEHTSVMHLKLSSFGGARAFLALLTLLCFSTSLHALPPERKDVRAGNKAYSKGDYATAEIDYRRALDKAPESANAKFNLGNALYKQTDSADAQSEGAKQQVEQARKLYENVAEADVSDRQKAAAHYNQGNTYLREQDFKAAVEAYKKSLRLNPNDMEAKQNLVYAQAMSNLQQQQPQPQQNQDQNKNDEQNKDDRQDQQQQDRQDQQQDNKNQQNKPQQDKNQQDKQQQQQREEKISKEDAQRMLQALEQQEKETQEKVKKEKAQKAKQRSTDKNW